MLRMLRPALSRSRHHTGAIAGMKFSPNGQRPATPGPDHAIKSWDAEELINSRTLRRTQIGLAVQAKQSGLDFHLPGFFAGRVFRLVLAQHRVIFFRVVWRVGFGQARSNNG